MTMKIDSDKLMLSACRFHRSMFFGDGHKSELFLPLVLFPDIVLFKIETKYKPNLKLNLDMNQEPINRTLDR
jgi:hypothetical protein